MLRSRFLAVMVLAVLCCSGASFAQTPETSGGAAAPSGAAVPTIPAVPAAPGSPAAPVAPAQVSGAQATATTPRSVYACNVRGASLNADQLLTRTLNWRDDLKLPPPQ